MSICAAYKNSTNTHPPLRLFVFAGSILLVFILPWWLTLAYAAYMIIWCRSYEMILLGLLLDFVYIPPETFILESAVPQTALLLLCVPCAWILKQYIREDEQSYYA